jgi:hypothetical protein
VARKADSTLPWRAIDVKRVRVGQTGTAAVDGRRDAASHAICQGSEVNTNSRCFGETGVRCANLPPNLTPLSLTGITTESAPLEGPTPSAS